MHTVQHHNACSSNHGKAARSQSAVTPHEQHIPVAPPPPPPPAPQSAAAAPAAAAPAATFFFGVGGSTFRHVTVTVCFSPSAASESTCSGRPATTVGATRQLRSPWPAGAHAHEHRIIAHSSTAPHAYAHTENHDQAQNRHKTLCAHALQPRSLCLRGGAHSNTHGLIKQRPRTRLAIVPVTPREHLGLVGRRHRRSAPRPHAVHAVQPEALRARGAANTSRSGQNRLRLNKHVQTKSSSSITPARTNTV